MAVDEVLLAQAAEEGLSTLRIYQWSEPTLSLGYFQDYADREGHAASRGCAVVRRQSGGGAILHDRELTYSISLPSGHSLAQETSELYRQVHRALIEFLQPYSATRPGLLLRVCEGEEVRSADNRAFLCFQRRSAGDVVLTNGNCEETVKVIGSAQRRREGAVLQHGSILLARSPAAPELPGLRDRLDLPVSEGPLAEAIGDRLAGLLGDATIPAELAIEKVGQVEQIAAEKYGSPTWTKRR
jgi:lipoate-protein ligase A